ncbi:MAG TPA: ABC transporter permease subunit, partial [Pseudomonas sp.]|nr:ABC transporter permease subunit [Pseudomonas sp.]
MNAIWTIARKEFSDGLRNRWIVAIGLLFALLAVGITWFGAAASGQLGFTNVPATIASLASLSTFLIPLIALLLAYDAIVGEEEDGTLALLLTYPLGRGQILLGKFIGHGMILALATLAGFGATALAIAVLVEDVGLATMFWAFGRFILSSILLGWVFLAMAYVLSGRAREKSTAAGLALAVWFFFVLVFDLAMLALLVLSEGRLSPDLLPWLLLFNPADVYRLINLAGLESGGNMAGVLALGVDLPMSTAALWAILCGWVAGALG